MDKRDVAATEFGRLGGRNGDEVTVEDVGLHALAVGLKLHSVAAAKKRGTKLVEKTRVLADLWLRPGHGEWPPLRWGLARIEKWSKARSG